MREKTMDEKEESRQDLPYIAFMADELVAIENVIGGYIQYLASFPPSPEGEKQISTLKQVRKQIQTQLQNPEPSIQIVLKPEEITELLAAMSGFVEQISKLFSKNDERDKVVTTVNLWRFRLLSILSEYQIE
jgi:hypothetical protein